ncbi:MAG: hypothetical protein ACTHU0_15415 [Kofleriaceae bacterium]
MNPAKILDEYPPGDPEAAMLLRAAEQLDAAIAEGPGWSTALGAHLWDMLSWREFHFLDGTILNNSDGSAVVGNTGAGLIVAAIDPEGRDDRWWQRVGCGILGERRTLAAERDLLRALSGAGIRMLS